MNHSRVPDALQRFYAAAQSRDPNCKQGRGDIGPGSAVHHTGRCFASPGVLRRIRGKRQVTLGA